MCIRDRGEPRVFVLTGNGTGTGVFRRLQREGIPFAAGIPVSYTHLDVYKRQNVYCTTKNLYQSTMELGTITSDIHKMLIGDDADLTYLYKLE